MRESIVIPDYIDLSLFEGNLTKGGMLMLTISDLIAVISLCDFYSLLAYGWIP